MEIESIMTLISNYAFPIACCIILFYKMEKDRASHREEMDKVTAALNNNTLVIQRLYDRLDGERNDR